MKFSGYSSLTGFRLIGKVGISGQARMTDVLNIAIPKDDLDQIAQTMLQELRCEFSPELVQLCRQIVEYSERAVAEEKKFEGEG